MRSQILLLCLILGVWMADCRMTMKMDYDWKFFQIPPNPPACPANSFPIPMDGIQCMGLTQAQASNPDECARQCCSEPNCETWQWCPEGHPCGTVASCWVGNMNSCHKSGDGWVGGGRNVTPPVIGKCDNPYCMPDFNDNSWRTLDVPHDFIIEGTFSPNAEQSHGYLPKGVGWYRKHFTVPSENKGQSVWIYFEGIYRDSHIYLNGEYLGSHSSGYTSFYFPIDRLLNWGSENLLAIVADARGDEGWWYEGGGIYRHVWLHIADPIHIATWGVYAPSQVTGAISHPSSGPRASSAAVSVSTLVVNEYTKDMQYYVDTKIVDKTGAVVGQASSKSDLRANTNQTISQKISLENVQLWDIKSPYLYSVVSTIKDSSNSTVLDEVNTPIGIRKSVFDKDQGFLLNDVNVKIKGFCNHQDFAGVGVAMPRSVNEFRVRKLQEMGANAWRMSHNPPNPDLLELTDELGMLVWDENRQFGDNPDFLADVSTLPLRDRNHPSIIIWSLCNEGGCMEGANDTNGLRIARLLKSIIEEYDETRPISAAWNSNLNDLIYGWGPKVLDLQGVNYNYGEYDPYHKTYPNKPMIGSETASCTGARGIYVTNDAVAHKSIFSADGCATEWWTSDANRKFIAGGFAWTGFDYKGEPTPYAWPCVNSNFGVIDLAGFPKDTFWYYQSWWINQTVLHVFPHWNAPEIDDSISTAPCSSGNKDQMFKFTGSGSNSGQLIDADGKCVSANCGDIKSGCAPLAVENCNSQDKNQLFFYHNDGSFVSAANEGCMDLWNSGEGPEVGVYECDSASNQHWTIESGAIKSQASGDRCLTSGAAKPIWVYSNAAAVELFVNGVSQGKKSMPFQNHVEWSTTWAPGAIEVRAYGPGGNVIKTETIQTTGNPAAIKLDVELGAELTADRQDAALIKVSIVDSEGRVVPTANNMVTFSVSGEGKIIGVGNGDPSSHEPDKANTRSAFNGLARVIVQSTDKAGVITLKAACPGLNTATVDITTTMPKRKLPTI